jgi:hypothetical protein
MISEKVKDKNLEYLNSCCAYHRSLIRLDLSRLSSRRPATWLKRARGAIH